MQALIVLEINCTQTAKQIRVRTRSREVKFIRIAQTKPRAKGRIIAVFRVYLTAA